MHEQILLKFIYSAKSSSYFWLQYIQSKVRGRFRKILWPSQNMWTLTNPLKSYYVIIFSFSSFRLCQLFGCKTCTALIQLKHIVMYTGKISSNHRLLSAHLLVLVTLFRHATPPYASKRTYIYLCYGVSFGILYACLDRI